MARPRTVSLEPEEMIKLGEEMVEWVMENKPIHLSMWYTQLKDFSDKEWNAMRQIPEFLHYYEKALKLVGYSYLDKDSNVDGRLKDRWQRVYFKDLKHQEDQDADAKIERELKSQSSIPPHDAQIDKENAEMSENARLRKRIAELEANAENKS
jgi:hypothetical protein